MDSQHDQSDQYQVAEQERPALPFKQVSFDQPKVIDIEYQHETKGDDDSSHALHAAGHLPPREEERRADQDAPSNDVDQPTDSSHAGSLRNLFYVLCCCHVATKLPLLLVSDRLDRV